MEDPELIYPNNSSSYLFDLISDIQDRPPLLLTGPDGFISDRKSSMRITCSVALLNSMFDESLRTFESPSSPNGMLDLDPDEILLNLDEFPLENEHGHQEQYSLQETSISLASQSDEFEIRNTFASVSTVSPITTQGINRRKCKLPVRMCDEDEGQESFSPAQCLETVDHVSNSNLLRTEGTQLKKARKRKAASVAKTNTAVEPKKSKESKDAISSRKYREKQADRLMSLELRIKNYERAIADLGGPDALVKTSTEADDEIALERARRAAVSGSSST